jgi:ATP-dependent helicase/nuclease subunit A
LSTKNPPTQEQLSIISTLEGDFVVLASAGSGKTFVVSERYLHLVQSCGVRPSEILTVTFTKKAAAEMKKRIVQRLRDAGLFSEAQEAETGPIQTIHSFYERILRENAVRAGLDPNFEVISQREVMLLKRDIIRRAATLDDGDEPFVAEFLQRKLGSRVDKDPSSYAEYVNLIQKTLNSFRESGNPRSFFADLYADPRAYLEKCNRFLFDKLPRVAQEAIRENPLEPWLQIAVSSSKAERCKPKWLNDRATEEQQLRTSRMICGLAQITLRCWLQLESELRKRQALDFQSLESRAVRLLESDSVVRRRLSRQYQHMMIDEAQDNNPNQYRLLDSIETVSKMLIGDDKQSIYSFRNAEVNQFRDRAVARTLRLSKNFRSVVGIQQAVDAVFGLAIGESYAPMIEPSGFEESVDSNSFSGIEVIRFSEDANWNELGEYILDLKSKGTPFSDMAVLVRKNKYVEQIESRLKTLGIGVRANSKASNLYARLEIRDVANLLSAISDPQDTFGLLAAIHSPIVDLTLDTTLLLSESIQSGSPITAILKNFETPVKQDQEKYSDFLEWFLPLASHADRLPAWETLSLIMKHSKAFHHLASRRNGRQRIENIRKLLVLATSHPEMSPGEFATMIRQIDRLSQMEGDAGLHDDDEDLVTVTTIHSSKGLEWNTVILADGQTQSKDRVTLPLLDNETGMLAYETEKPSAPIVEYLRSEQTKRYEDELLRIQYVACTRAKQRLVIAEWKDAKAGIPQLFKNGMTSGIYGSLPTWRKPN